MLYSPLKLGHVMPHEWTFFLTALLSPMLFWAILAIAARRRPGILPALYPSVKVLCWVLWVCAAALGLVSLVAYPKFPWLPWTLVAVFYSGLNIVRDWMKRRVESTTSAKKPAHGWWPSPRNY